MTSFTIGIDKPEVLAKKIEEAEGYPLLNIKRGNDHDPEIMKIVNGKLILPDLPGNGAVEK